MPFPSAGELPANGLDDDGDGTIDEQTIYRVQDGVSRPVLDGVTSFEVSRAAGSEVIEIEFQVVRRVTGGALRVQPNRLLIALRNSIDRR